MAAQREAPGDRVVLGPDLLVEGGDVGSLFRSNRVAIVSSWTSAPQISLSLSRYLAELDAIGFPALVVNTTDSAGPLEWPHGRPDSTVVARRPNIGYDFGSWAAALSAFPRLRRKPAVLLTNDSLVGPFEPLSAVATAIAESHADVLALTESRQLRHHPQSFFLLFRGGILADGPWIRFFDGVREETSKDDIVKNYELGVARTCAMFGYSWEAVVGTETSLSGSGNPTFESWRTLFEAGLPIVKRSLVTDPAYGATTAEIADVVYRAYGQSLKDWLPDGLLPAALGEGDDNA